MKHTSILLNKTRRVCRRIMLYTSRFWTNDKLYLEFMYYFVFGTRLNLKSPQTFNEKLQWLKLYNRKTEYTNLVDKFSVKEIVAQKIGRDHIIPTIAIWNKISEIEWNILPKQFVLKTTNGGGGCGIVICQDKDKFNKERAVNRLSSSLNTNIFIRNREWPYKNVKPRIIAEKYMNNGGSGDIHDYKFFCFNGTPKYMLISSDRYSGHYFDYFNMEGRHLPFEQGGKNAPVEPELPQTFKEMVKIATELSSGIPHVRVDLYEINNVVYFGELTFFDSSGFDKFYPEKWDRIIGDYLELPENK